ncbi:membrane protein involved in the export of O-antigen and teichoic acid [Halovivax ruber XH-70]|uniref:Membrane protein involved in the export of O-antigen and teichoic acid n=1 Tax=Halovivax ruber (strain DSM 18193 / JCM 13892 / XH-70) TaxID=797302 RepID=L0IDC2_HALRX|nr:oligosaccharide flippase family protein [Halovivax ruber]AGB16226.1 membrane protein involved in the export of O-antigen and teichoic acid [Halovivax ruber XH-70]
MSVTDRIVRGFKATLAARVVDALANGLLMVLLARVLLSPSEYGQLFFVLAVVGVAQLVADLGLSRSAARYVAERKETDPGSVPFVVRSSLRYKLLLIIVVAGGLVLGADVVASLLGTPAVAGVLGLGACYLAVQSLAAYAEILFQGFNRLELSAVVKLTNNLSRLVAVVILTGLGFGVAGALLGYVAGAFLGAAVGLGYLFGRLYRSFEDTGGSRALRNSILAYSVPLTASHSANVLDKRIDTVLVGALLNPLAVSYYVLSKQITEFVLVPAGSLGFSVSPTYGEQKANDALDHAARIYESTVEVVLLLYVPAAVGLIVIAEPAVRMVFGSAYLGAVPVLQVLGIYVVFQAITSVTTNGLDYLGRAKHRAIAKGTTSIANVLLNVVLIPIYGVVGAAAATVVTFGAYTAVSVYVMHRELSLDFARLGRRLVLVGGISVGMGLAVVSMRPFISTVIGLVGVVGLGVCVWMALAVASGLMDVQETIGLLR